MIARKLDPAIGENKYVLVITPVELDYFRIAILPRDDAVMETRRRKACEELYDQLLEITSEDD